MRNAAPTCLLATGLALAAACSTSSGDGSSPAAPAQGGDAGSIDAGADAAAVLPTGTFVHSDPQRTGDPKAGYTALVNNGYIGCGIPYALYEQVYGVAPASALIPGRTGDNATLPYNYTAFQSASGVELVTANCLTCHAGRINGQLVVGLGAADGDITSSIAQEAQLVGQLITDPTEQVEWAKWNDRVQAISPYTLTTTVGQNPADNLAAILFAHRDPTTLAWSDTPLLALPPTQVVPVHVPPWWRMKKKNAMFFNAAGHGDHARIMMTASTLCTDTVSDAKAIDAYFPDVEAYIESITPPKYPFPIDQGKATAGHAVFATACAPCHGTYDGAGAYPNLVFATADVGTDATLAVGSSQFAGRFVNWFNTSWYGQIAKLEPQPGYIAPPLDGIWATAPYLHNGSVPTIGALLDSTKRPKFWTRTFSSTDYDQANVGWNITARTQGQAGVTDPSVKKTIYDTTQPGTSNAGHTFGDALSDADRSAVLEYLKTL